MAEELKTAPVEVDINDLSLAAEPLNVNPDADAFAIPSPPPKGIYAVRAKRFGGWAQAAAKKSGAKYFSTRVELRLIAPGERFDDNPVFDFVSTLVMDSTRTSRAIGILTTAGVPVPSQTTDVDIARALDKLLAGEPTLKIEADWEGYCSVCEKTVLRGQAKFPEGKHQVACRKCGGPVSAQVRVVRYLNGAA